MIGKNFHQKSNIVPSPHRDILAAKPEKSLPELEYKHPEYHSKAIALLPGNRQVCKLAAGGSGIEN